MEDLRCENKKHGVLFDGVIEIKCNSRFCRDSEPGVVVLHRFDAKSGALLETQKFKDPL